jgi:hypothetical protein
MFILGIALIFAGILLAYYAVEDDRRRREERQVAVQYEAAMAAGKTRHPSRDAA